MTDNIAKIGVIHGRFQILHNDHLTYLLSGKALCRHLVVGITNPDPRLMKAEDADPRRHDPKANPLTYYERQILVSAALTEADVKPDDFSIVPFPINTPELYRYYVPMDALFFLVIYDDWGRQKLEYFKSLGLNTHILRDVPPDRKGISAGHVRRLMAEGKPWEHLVPECVAELVKEWKIHERLNSHKD